MTKYIPTIDSLENYRRGDEKDPRSPWYDEPIPDEEQERLDDYRISQAEDNLL